MVLNNQNSYAGIILAIVEYKGKKYNIQKKISDSVLL
jgi:hypothetical protein